MEQKARPMIILLRQPRALILFLKLECSLFPKVDNFESFGPSLVRRPFWYIGGLRVQGR